MREKVKRPDVVNHFHSGLSRDARSHLMRAFREWGIRVLVTTTSLKMGVNFPVTDVIVRDTYFHGSGRLPVRDIMQMTGRAGRGNTPGHSWIVCDRIDSAEFYKEGLASGRVEPLEPQLMRATGGGRQWKQKASDIQADPVRALILTELAAHKEAAGSDVAKYGLFYDSVGLVQTPKCCGRGIRFDPSPNFVVPSIHRGRSR